MLAHYEFTGIKSNLLCKTRKHANGKFMLVIFFCFMIISHTLFEHPCHNHRRPHYHLDHNEQ
jgi:hypothetical protein